MKLIKQEYSKDGDGVVKLVAEEPEDMWHAYNLIREGDRVTATTFRKITKDTGGAVRVHWISGPWVRLTLLPLSSYTGSLRVGEDKAKA